MDGDSLVVVVAADSQVAAAAAVANRHPDMCHSFVLVALVGSAGSCMQLENEIQLISLLVFFSCNHKIKLTVWIRQCRIWVETLWHWCNVCWIRGIWSCAVWNWHSLDLLRIRRMTCRWWRRRTTS